MPIWTWPVPSAPLESSGAVRISRRRRNWWIEMVYSTWRDANDAWLLQAEAASVGHAAELADFKAQHPQPRLEDFLIEMSPRRQRDHYQAAVRNSHHRC
jgi:hypothetical protein